MGRLTLNVLLSFAQFEREVTAERIRDKIAASKKKGLWMGGNVPLGYEPDGRTLKIIKKEAETVKAIYDLSETFRHRFKFGEHYGENWDALIDCMRDVPIDTYNCGFIFIQNTSK
jgi:DNA invertase Pin-like site-specific DNA recombinase